MQRRRGLPAASAVLTLALVLTAGPVWAESPPSPSGSASVSTAPAAPPTEGVSHDQNPAVPEGAVWTEVYVPAPLPSSTGDPVELHADVLRPAHLAADARTPVILSMGPYFSHSGQSVDEGREFAGPSLRHRRFIDAADLFAAGYTVVLADIRGFGGSDGCLDHLGTAERADVAAVVEWAASAPWSTGRVGMYGKSYDATTGLVAMGEHAKGLAAVVAQEPMWDASSYFWSNGVPTANNTGTVVADLRTASLPGIGHDAVVDGVTIPADTARYRDNAAYEESHPSCAEDYYLGTRASSADDPYWRERDIVGPLAGSEVPLFFTQGLTEQNTRPFRLTEALDGLRGPVQAWMGPWNHVTGDDVDPDGRLAMGRPGWVDEVRAFFDAHLRDAPAPAATFAVQDNRGTWRVESEWPGATRDVTAEVQPGRYLDDSVGAGDGDEPAPPLPETVGTALTLSQPVARPTRLIGAGSVEVRTKGEGTIYVRLWDVAPDGIPTVISDAISTASESGRTTLQLLAADWTLSAGHALLMSVSTTDTNAWSPTPSGSEVIIDGGTLRVSVRGTDDDVPTAGEPAPFLEQYLAANTLPAPVAGATATFSLEDAAPVPTPAPTATGAPVPAPEATPAPSLTATPPAALAKSGTAVTPSLPMWGLAVLVAGALVLTLRRGGSRGGPSRR